jgi:serine protease
VTLTVTDDGGASDTASQAIAPITGLTANGYKDKGLHNVNLTWNSAGINDDVYRNSTKIATVQGSSYTDNINRKGSASYTYKVCAQAAPTICSNQATVSF